MTNARSRTMGAFGVVAVFLAITSVAYACTVYKGKMTVSGNGAGSVDQTVHGARNNDMNWCHKPLLGVTNPPTPWTVEVTEGIHTSGPNIGTGKAHVEITTGTSNFCKGTGAVSANFLANGTYDVAVHVGEMPAGGGDVTTHNCHSGTNIPIGTFTVSGGAGAGTGSYDYVAPGQQAGDIHSLCVFGQGFADANAINITQVV